MSTCKDCVHYEPCRDTYYNDEEQTRIPYNFLEKEGAEKNCAFFKDRSKFVELPYKVKPKDKVWYILEGLDDLSLKDYKTTSGDCAVGDIPDTVIDVSTKGFFTNALHDRQEDYLGPDDCDFILWDEIGKSYFLTREEAEQALKERETE